MHLLGEGFQTLIKMMFLFSSPVTMGHHTNPLFGSNSDTICKSLNILSVLTGYVLSSVSESEVSILLEEMFRFLLQSHVTVPSF